MDKDTILITPPTASNVPAPAEEKIDPKALYAEEKIKHAKRLVDRWKEKENYAALIEKHAQIVVNEETCPTVSDYQIYFCWFQGEDQLPPLVRCCYNSLKKNAGQYKIVFLDDKNLFNYVDIAPHIMDKFNAGKITRTHFSDILRVNLLERHGGLWLDATVLVTKPLERYKIFWSLPFFSTKDSNKEDISNRYIRRYYKRTETYVTGFRWHPWAFGTAIQHNPLFAFMKDFFEEYWREYDRLINYFLVNHSIRLAYDNIPFVREEIDNLPINNHIYPRTQHHLNASYEKFPYDKILKSVFLHKLTYKKELDMTTHGTVFRKIQRRYAPETLI